MKKLKKNIIICLLFLLSMQLFSQTYTCPITGLADDISDSTLGNAVETFVDNNFNGIDTWIFMFDAFERTRVFTKDILSLTMLKSLLDDVVFKSRMGDKFVNDLSTIIEKNKILHCKAAGSASGYGELYSTFPEFLDEFRYLVNNFDTSKGGAQQFYRWAKRTNIDDVVMSNEGLPIIAEMYQTLYILKKRGFKEADIISFGGAFSNGSNKFDLLTHLGKYIELKNVDFVTYPLKGKSQVIDQLINGYFKNIKSFDDFEWIASLKKLKAKGWLDEATALTNMKKQFKDMLQENNNAQNAFDVIWSNDNLRIELFSSVNQFDEIIKAQKMAQFNNWIDNMNDIIFKFIKVE